jgi:hypothetical protein
MMIVNPIMVILCIQLPKYHDNDDLVIHIQQLTKVYVTNGKDMNDHNSNIFLIFLEGKLLMGLPCTKQLIQQ